MIRDRWMYAVAGANLVAWGVLAVLLHQLTGMIG